MISLFPAEPILHRTDECVHFASMSQRDDVTTARNHLRRTRVADRQHVVAVTMNLEHWTL